MQEQYRNLSSAAMTGRQERNVVAIPAQPDKSLPPVTMEVTIYSPPRRLSAAPKKDVIIAI